MSNVTSMANFKNTQNTQGPRKPVPSEQKLYFDFMSACAQDSPSVNPSDDPMKVLALVAWELQEHLQKSREMLGGLADAGTKFPALRRKLSNRFYDIADTLVDIFSYTTRLVFYDVIAANSPLPDQDPEDLIDIMEDLSNRLDYADNTQARPGMITLTTSEGNAEVLRIKDIEAHLDAIGNLIMLIHQDLLKLDAAPLESTFPKGETFGFYLMNDDSSFNAVVRLMKLKYNAKFLAPTR